MALVTDLITELSVMSGIPEASIAVVARRLREDGLLSQKGRGRGAAQATPLDAARLCIALMIGGKAKDASFVVRDFGQLRLYSFDVEPKHPYGGLTLEATGLNGDHKFEEGLAALIGVWGQASLVETMEALAGPVGLLPAMLARLDDSGMTGRIFFGVSDYIYNHAALIQANNATDSNARLALTEQYLAASSRYGRGIRSSREISGVEILPLGEVVAGLRKPGWRESEQATLERLTEAFLQEARTRDAGSTSDAADEGED